MCTNVQLLKTRQVEDWAIRHGLRPEDFRYSPDFRPGSVISIVTGVPQAEPILRDAIWWLYLKQTEQGVKPHPDYFSVNTNHAKLGSKPEYKTQRCIVPVSAFAESQDGKNPHLLTPDDGEVMCLGGLYKHWIDKATGEEVFSASIITLPGHPALADIHKKSIPLWLREEDLALWLDPFMHNTEVFNDWLKPRITRPLTAQPIERISSKNPIGESHRIHD
jgi:putative SOS response-associated peptidase YedK